ncbi:MAG: Hsp20/alpha crystallin family protein [Rickettsiaceae bacterium]|jgi:HSP20 family protein|uniref:Hsp20/alpha crystallin family protein n=1 Tax=Candidatus Megaera polyxenophila TaxID=988779 RepID=UPI001B745B8D|nr:Hsp20/alpha crystallin family protein [Candidatus Megaera polyxenophila]MBP9777906.1 Hsp20/alpha crystallin family protein [Rickettsiaceae bacterium]NBY35038.1 Hsp20/alpha crystallin family protein [Alphaproteobacteria bacterium]UCM94486.1 MAG: Hsp20/alpha crystallin family protein [Candidatus Megaira endosymbiont of Mesostigma viride]HJK85280.1 Hsp20/alpha crystallin family protein [Candidatus Megaera endosymbiont of Stentor roeselii]MCC8460939.1 Hsp20/alpha crystallin family protein [Cand
MAYLPKLRSKSESIRTRDSVFDDLFNELYSLPTSFLSKSGVDLSPRIDISETDAAYKIEAELPGINQKEIDVKIDNNILTIKGKKEDIKEEKEKNYHLRERYYGAFQRSISLPNNIEPEKIKASFENGVLNISVPKNDKRTPKKIEIS